MADVITKQVADTDIDTELVYPKKYKVVVLNDDTTPIEFVIAMLITIFGHSEETAYNITMQIHNEGVGIAGVYSHEVAEQKGVESTMLARDHGYPLAIKIEEE